MTTKEFSTEFDILYNNISSNQAPGIDEYEKSVFLTRAQESLILNYYNGNQLGDSFEKTEEVRRYLSELVKTAEITTQETDVTKIGSDNDACFKLPKDVWFIVYEAITVSSDNNCMNSKTILVKPVTHDDFSRTVKNPFNGPNDRQALRLDLENNMVEIVSKYPVTKYTIRYVSKPSPIILTNLSNLDPDLSINEETNETQCALHSALHFSILRTAVVLALSSFQSTMVRPSES